MINYFLRLSHLCPILLSIREGEGLGIDRSHQYVMCTWENMFKVVFTAANHIA